MLKIQQRKGINIMRKLLIALSLVLFATTVAQAREQINIVGSSTVYPFSTVVAERFGKSGKFKTPVIESTGTGGGMKLFCAGIGTNTPDMSNASRKIKPKEVKLCKNNNVTDITEVIVGLDGIAFTSSVDGKEYNFTKKQLWEAMSQLGSKPVKWSDIDPSLPDYKISILTPPATSGTRDAWNSLVMKKGCPEEILKEQGKKACYLLREDGPVIEVGENDTLIINKLVGEPTYFGIFGFSYYDNSKDKVQAHKIEGKEISLSSIQDGSYPISRPLYFYVKNQHIGIVPGIEEFVKEFTSKRASGKRGYLKDLGLVPLANPKEAISKVE
jgi:phosphate transport system substrate-binding protein